MLVQLIFASVATEPGANGGGNGKAVEAILRQGRQHNAENSISGVLCHGYGIYLEAMEGERGILNKVYADVLRDERHSQVELLHFEEITERAFANWSLGRVHLEKLNASAILKYTPHLPLQPSQWSGKSALAFLKDLVASASVLAK